jgi:Flp pilus assembly protein TadD
LPDPIAVAFLTALIWATHPLNTEAVTYLVQRAESLMGLFYLLTLYGYVRSLDSEHGFFWLNVSVAACCLGMGTKEVMVSAPLTVLLFDRTFVAGTFRESLHRRGSYYGALGASWLVLAALVYSTHGRGSTVGFGIGVSWPAYLASQPMAILRYLRLAFLPLGQNFDYGLVGVGDWRSALLTAPVIVGLGIASIVGIVRGTPWGFLGWCFFAVLAPTSLLPGVRQAIAEHRMYLALIPVVVLTILACHQRFGRKAFPFYFLAAVVFGGLTIRRNAFYRDEVLVYTDAVEQSPDNPFALSTLGGILMERGDLDGAALLFQRSIHVQRINQVARDNLGAILIKKGKVDAAIAVYREAIALSPKFANAYVNLGNALLLRGLPQAAISSYRDAQALDPSSARDTLGVVLERAGKPEEAEAEYRTAIGLQPGEATAHFHLAGLLARTGRREEAIREARMAVALDPTLTKARVLLRSLGVARP